MFRERVRRKKLQFGSRKLTLGCVLLDVDGVVVADVVSVCMAGVRCV